MMFNQYPYLNLNDLNLDYILAQIKTMMNEVTNFVSINAIKYADPIQWDIPRQYEKNTVVIDPVTGTAYISVAPVPAGVALTRPEYWTVVFDLGSFVTRAAQNFTRRYEQETTLTATFPSNTGEWLVWGDVLYKAKTNITAGDTYVVDGNIEHFTIEDLYNAYLNTIATILAIVGNLVDLRTSDTSSIVNAINSVVDDLDNLANDLAQEVTDRANADNALLNDFKNYLSVSNESDNATFAYPHKVGDLIWWNGELYKVILGVAVGDTINDDNDRYGNVIQYDISNVFATMPLHDRRSVLNSDGAISNLLHCASTYLLNNSALAYGNYETALSVTTTNVIDCSTFCQLCLMGVTYENSRYVLGSARDNVSIGGYLFDDMGNLPTNHRPYGLLANDLFKYAQRHNFDYEITSIDDIRTGDIIFVSNSSDPLYYDAIGHCAIVVQVNAYNNSVICIEAQNVTNPIIISTYFLSNPQIRHGARFPLADAGRDANNLCAGYDPAGVTFTITAWQILSGNLFAIPSYKPFKAGHFYTLKMQLDAPLNELLHLGLYVVINGVTRSISPFATKTEGRNQFVTFLMPVDMDNSDIVNGAYVLRLRALLNASQASNFTDTINPETVELYEGFYSGLNENDTVNNARIFVNLPMQSTSITNLTDLNNYLLGLAQNAVGFTEVRGLIQLSGVGSMKGGRYFVTGYTYNSGVFGYFILHNISASDGTGIIYYVANNNGTLVYHSLDMTAV